MSEIRVMVVDDEVHARNGLRTMLEDERGFKLIGEASSGTEAVAGIRNLHPDLVFLDIEMPDMTGLEVITEVGADSMPLVIFVTAYDEYAVAAFEASAVDYLLKPFTDDRFRRALDRARDTLRRDDERHLGERLRRLLGTHPGTPGELERFTVKIGDALKVYRVEEIDWIEADEYYVKLHVNGQAHMVRQTMSALEDVLPADRFARIHRSSIVNLDRIAALEPMFQGDYTVVLKDGTRLRMSRRRRESLAGLLKSFS